jgi:hypothetical protein
MKRLSLVLMALALTALLACGRVPDRAQIGELDANQVDRLCTELREDYPVQSVTCEIMGFEVDADIGLDLTQAECVESLTSPGCDVLVGNLRGCYESIFDPDAFCSLDPSFSGACDGLEDCVPASEEEDDEAL